MIVRKLIRRVGLDIVRYPHKHIQHEVSIVNTLKENRFKLMKARNIDLVLDVGANEGQFGEELRSYGYKGNIVSFEPLNSAFSKLRLKADTDELWNAHNVALGDSNIVSEINIAGNSQSSSILDMGIVHQTSAPESIYVGRQEIQVRKLADYFETFNGFSNIYLKLDVQGYEKKVFDGLERNIDKINGIQIEMSLVELYKSESTFFVQSEFLISSGFKLMSLEPGFFDRDSGQLLQVDGIWYRS